MSLADMVFRVWPRGMIYIFKISKLNQAVVISNPTAWILRDSLLVRRDWRFFVA